MGALLNRTIAGAAATTALGLLLAMVADAFDDRPRVMRVRAWLRRRRPDAYAHPERYAIRVRHHDPRTGTLGPLEAPGLTDWFRANDRIRVTRLGGRRPDDDNNDDD